MSTNRKHPASLREGLAESRFRSVGPSAWGAQEWWGFGAPCAGPAAGGLAACCLGLPGRCKCPPTRARAAAGGSVLMAGTTPILSLPRWPST